MQCYRSLRLRFLAYMRPTNQSTLTSALQSILVHPHQLLRKVATLVWLRTIAETLAPTASPAALAFSIDGGGDGYCPRVLHKHQIVSTTDFLFIHYYISSVNIFFIECCGKFFYALPTTVIVL